MYTSGTKRAMLARLDGTARFNVRLNGLDIAQEVTFDRAQELADQIRAARVSGTVGRGFIQVYLSDKGLDGRKAAWRKASLPRPYSLRVSAAERAKLEAKLRAEGIMHDDPPHVSHSAATLAAGPL